MREREREGANKPKKERAKKKAQKASETGKTKRERERERECVFLYLYNVCLRTTFYHTCTHLHIHGVEFQNVVRDRRVLGLIKVFVVHFQSQRIAYIRWEYGVVTMSRLLQIIGLFCKRDL